MGSPITITLAGEPRGKGRPRFAKATGRAFTPTPTRNYEAALRIEAQHAMAGRAPIEGPLTVRVRAVFAIPASMTKGKRQMAVSGQLRPLKTPDADNLMKTLDALNQVVFVDDKQVVEATISKFYGEQPALHITVEPWA
jgi:Holliday junction resolvase RusA-like endonuclease